MRGAAVSLIWELKRHPFFEAVPDDKLEGLLDAARPVVFARRKQIFAQGDDSDCLYIILSGRVKVSSFSDAGKETVLAFMGENEVLGEMGAQSWRRATDHRRAVQTHSAYELSS